MIVIVSGSRHWRSSLILSLHLDMVRGVTNDPRPVDMYVGDCPSGADKLALKYAEMLPHWEASVFHADWLQYGNPAGPIRNQQMIDEALKHRRETKRLVIAATFPMLNSRGTKDFTMRARDANIKVYEVGGIE